MFGRPLNNNASIIGIIESEPIFDHATLAGDIYTFIVCVPRHSGTVDRIRVTASEDLLRHYECRAGDKVKVAGQFRSYNVYKGGKNHLYLTVFARTIDKPWKYDNIETATNFVYLNGFICKPPVYRTTPFGREVTDILLAVNRSKYNSDYIPLIAWGRNARFAKNLEVGDNIRIRGRIQSRDYQKRISEEEAVTKTAYEVSINLMEYVDKDTQ